MEQRGEQHNKGRMTLWKQMLMILLPVFSVLLAGTFVFLCVSYLTVKPIVTVELGSASPEAEAFANGDEREIVYLRAPEPLYREIGNHWLTVRSGGITRLVLLCVKDRTAPAAEPVETTVSTKEAPTPDKLVKNLQDQSILKLTYVRKPAYGTVGDYEAIVRLEDAGGNATDVYVPVHVRITVDAVTVEAGDPAPDVSAFLIDAYDAELLDPITPLMLSVPGTYPIRIRADGVEAKTTLIVRDTIAPTASPKTAVVKPDAVVSPYDLVSEIQDATAVTATFVTDPDLASREPQTVKVKLVDLGGNETVVTSNLLISHLSPFVFEATKDTKAVLEILTEQAGGAVTLSEPFVPNEPGLHLLHVRVGDEDNIAIIDVQDTVAPVLSVNVQEWYLNASEPAAFFASVKDVTETTVSFETEPDWTVGEQQVTILAVDAGGNTTRETFSLRLIPDTEPPILYGVRDRYCYLNETVAYFLEVSAEDNCDGAVEVQVDASHVDATKVGVYPVTYRAADRTGNETVVTVQMTVVAAKVSEEDAEAAAQKILKQILTDDMSLAQQIEAIYNYVFRNIHYVATSNKTDWRSEAVRGLTTGKGDCFTYYAAARLLLEHTDAQILSVERKGGSTRHYWLLVNIGTGWYHYDACNAGTGKKRCFMWTNAQKDAVSTRFWRYEESLYPPVATQPYRGGK